MRSGALSAVVLAWAATQTGGATAATLSGVFVDPVGPVGLVVSGVGSNVIRTGEPGEGEEFPTILRFDPEDSVPEVRGQTFVGGIVGFRNGTIVTDTGFSSVTLRATTQSDNADFNQILNERIVLLNTTNLETNTAEQNADVFYWGDRSELGGFRVLEGETGFVEALFEFNSLDLVGFGNVLTPSVAFLTESAFAAVDPEFSVAPVPVPGALPLLAGAFGLLGMVRTRRPRAAA